jgi:predicted amino acid dehydrogenase
MNTLMCIICGFDFKSAHLSTIFTDSKEIFMDNNSELHVVFGASGSIGSAVVRELAKRGKRVRAVNRTGKAKLPPSIEMIKGDASNLESVRQACQGAGVVYH